MIEPISTGMLGTLVGLYIGSLNKKARIVIDRINKVSKIIQETNFSETYFHYVLNNNYDNISVVKINDKVDDDEDVYGTQYRVYFKTKVTNEIKVPIADFYFYSEKPYKKRMEIVCQEQEDNPELNYLDELVKKLMRTILKRQLRKKSLA